MKHDDALEDKKLIHSMLKKALPGKKVASHLKKDIGESKKSIHEDKKLMKSLKRAK
ncbi:MAG: hypothetical protein LLG04_19015 [Parachlamydia sp.]|jgi:hypothetical protein|nr:hypothetical protein [Parachlamydia sp.]